MNDLFLSKATIDAYLRDLLLRLYGGKDSPKPQIWCSIGTSGGEICSEMLALVPPSLKAKIGFVKINLDRSLSGGVSFHDVTPNAEKLTDEVAISYFSGKTVLLIDGLVHSGGTIRASYNAIKQYNPSALISYSTIVRESSAFIPNYFSVLIGKYEHAWLSFVNKQEFPNKRFDGFGCIRKIDFEEDLTQEIPTAAANSRFETWQDISYNCSKYNYKCYVYEKNGIIQGYLVCVVEKVKKELLVVSLVIDTKYKGNFIPGDLLRWMETYANAKHLKKLLIWVTKAEYEFFQDLGYDFAEETAASSNATMMSKDVPYPLPYGEWR